MRRLLVAVLAVAAASALSGCERLCSQGAVTWCPRSEGDALNDAPREVLIRARLDVGTDRSSDRLTVVFRGEAVDPDGDPLRFEWDLDGDGAFERTGRVVSRSFHRTARPRVTLRVTDVPRQLGAPGDVRVTRVVAVADLDVNRAPAAAVHVRSGNFAWHENDDVRAYAGQVVSFSPVSTRLNLPPPVDPDSGDDRWLAFRWRFGEDGRTGRSARADHAYERVGAKTVRLTVTDPFGASSTAMRQVEVLPSPVPPTARMTVSPESPLVGETVTLDASASTRGDLPIAEYRFLPGEDSGVVDITGPVATVRYRRPGQQTILLRVRDGLGFTGEASTTIRVRPDPAVNSPPDASFTVTPSSPFVGQEVRLDASASADHEGPIARYEWDLDGDFVFEVDRGTEPVLITRFTMPEEEKVVRLQVTDAGGLTDWDVRVIRVGGSAGAARSARAGRVRAAALPFSAQLSGRPLPGHRGDRRRSSLLGVLGEGRLRARVADVPGRATRAERALRRFLDAPWRTRVGFVRDRRTGRLTANALALATPRGGRSAACLRIRLVARPGEPPTGRLSLAGGRGAGARLRASGGFRFRLERDGSATTVGDLAAASGAPRGLPRSCRRLARAG